MYVCMYVYHIHHLVLLLLYLLKIYFSRAGRYSDSGVLSNSCFGEMLRNGSSSFPSPKPLPGSVSPKLPYVVVGDEAFPLRGNMLHLYPGHNLPGQL